MKILEMCLATEWRPKVAHGETVGFAIKTNQAPERGERHFRSSIFCRPIRGLKNFWNIQPTVSPWAAFCRASGALVVAILFFGVGATAETTNNLSDAEIQGRQLVQTILEQTPGTNFFQKGILKIHDKEGNITNVFLSIHTEMMLKNWQITYEGSYTTNTYNPIWVLSIYHVNGHPNQYWHAEDKSGLIPARSIGAKTFNENQIMIPFADSDFWVCDLGLEFFHWPQQKVLKKEFHRQCACVVLESTNPNPTTNGYSRVVSWIDEESLGIVEAYAYDANDKKLKNFYPKNFEKVNGQYQVQSLIMENLQTGSRTVLEFDLKK
jgi:hypothetical protein